MLDYKNKFRLLAIGMYFPVFFDSVQSNDESFFLDNKLARKVSIMAISGVRTLCKKTLCQAKLIITKVESQGINPITIGNFDKSPASKFCILNNGVPGILFDQNRNNVSICEFEDGSLFLTWDLLNKLKKSEHLSE